MLLALGVSLALLHLIYAFYVLTALYITLVLQRLSQSRRVSFSLAIISLLTYGAEAKLVCQAGLHARRVLLLLVPILFIVLVHYTDYVASDLRKHLLLLHSYRYKLKTA